MTRATSLSGLQRMKQHRATLRFAHGDRNRYLGGCRCGDCRAANAAYQRESRRRRAGGEWNGYVPADRARQHLRQLQAQGVGRRAVADAADVSRTTIAAVRDGRQLHLRAAAERRILQVTHAQASDCALVDGTETWRLIHALVEEGYTRKFIAERLGYRGHAIPLMRGRVTVRNAQRVRDLHDRLTGEIALPLPAHKPRPNWKLRRLDGRARASA